MIIKPFLLILSLILFAALSGCGGGESDSPVAKSNAAKGANRNSAPTAPQTVPGSNNTNAGPTDENTQAQNPMVAARNKKLEAMRQAARDPNAPKPDIEETLRKNTRPAPENSEFSVVLSDILVERRTFLKHPILAKVEKVTDGENKTIRVFTTDGKSLVLPGDAIDNLSTASSASILKAAGMNQPSQQPSEKKIGASNRN